MNYPRLNKKKRERPIFFPVVGAVVVIVVIIHFTLPTLFSGFFLMVGRPLWHLRDALTSSLSGATSLLNSKGNLIRENNRLRLEVMSLGLVEERRSLLEKENGELRGLLSMRPQEKNMATAAILVRPGASPYDTLVVDSGSDQGIRSGMVVYLPAGSPIGTVENVYKRTSKIKLFSFSGEEVPVIIGGTVHVLAHGKGNGNFEARIPKNVAIKEGDAVTLAQLPHVYMSRVEAIEAESADSFERVYFQIPANLNESRFVFIDKGSLQE